MQCINAIFLRAGDGLSADIQLSEAVGLASFANVINLERREVVSAHITIQSCISLGVNQRLLDNLSVARVLWAHIKQVYSSSSRLLLHKREHSK